MEKILLITVGGSPEPILTAIETLQPDRVIFLCSDGAKGSKSQVIGEGNPCEIRRGLEVEKKPNIPTQLGLGDRFQPERDLVLIQDPDDLSECYRLATAKIRALQQEFVDAQILAEYTGGTKTMSAALSVAALDYRIPMYVTTSVRRNLIRVESGELTERAAASSIIVERTIEQFLPLLLEQYNYPAAMTELKIPFQMELPSSALKSRVRKLYTCCAGFDAWDKFDHAAAWQLLKDFTSQQNIQPVVLFLKRVMGSRETLAEAVDDNFKAPDKMRGHGYEIVEDLVLNAERRAILERFDDAVARLYRALELLVQVRLWERYQIKTGDVDLQKLPESLLLKYEGMRSPDKDKIQLGLSASYFLLSELPDDPLGKLYLQRHKAIIDALKIRNYSILAHGLRPVTKSDYEQTFVKVVIPFIQTGIAAIIPPKDNFQPVQFPRIFSI